MMGLLGFSQNGCRVRPSNNLISGLHIYWPVSSQSGTWVGLVLNGVDIYPDGAASPLDGLTRITYAIGNDFTDIAAGQYTTSSNYNQTAVISDSAESGSYHWNPSSGTDQNLYIKFASPIKLVGGKIEINFNGNYPYIVPAFYDTLGNEITPVTAPTGWGDAIETGVPVAAADRQRWTF